jgi:hypothetical protein
MIGVMLSMSLESTCVWADIVKALNSTNDVHYLMTVTDEDGTIEYQEGWLKNKRLLRIEDSGRVTVDNGQDRLILDQEARTAQLMDSFAPFEDFIADDLFELLLLFRGEETPYTADLLEDECSGQVLVFAVTYREEPFGKVWVDPDCRLPLKILSEERGRHVEKWEAVFDYNTISHDRFNIEIPSGFRVLPRRISPSISGSVIDEQGNPVADALVHLLRSVYRGMWAQTDAQGAFQIKLPPFRRRLELPTFVRAFRPDDPSQVAWMVILNPQPMLSDGDSEYQNGDGVSVDFCDREALYRDIPGSPGEITFQETDAAKEPVEVRHVMLQMTQAKVIKGKAIDDQGYPVVNAGITADYTVMRWGNYRNRLELQRLSDPRQSEGAFTLTDSQGCYILGNLPDLPGNAESTRGRRYKIQLEAKAEGYFTEEKQVEDESACNFRLVQGAVVVRGTVIDDHGASLVCREVEVEIEEDDDEHDERDFDIEGAVIDETGRFELAVPRVPNLMLSLELDNPFIWRNNWTDKNVDKDEKDPTFIYYRDMQVPLVLEKGKNEYWIEIVPRRPDITVTVKVMDDVGNPLPGIPVIPYSGQWMGGEMTREWSLYKLAALTDANGQCIVAGVPRVSEFILMLCDIPESFVPFGYENRVLEYFKKHLSADMIKALAASRAKYQPIEIPLELAGNINKDFFLNVTLKAGGRE